MRLKVTSAELLKMCHLGHRLRICLFHGKVLSSRYSSFCIFNHSMLYQICDVMMSISTWDRVHLWMYFLNHNSLTHQTWSIHKYKPGQYFSKTFWIIRRTGAKFNLPTFSNDLITNYVKFPVFHFSVRVNKGGELKMVY